jgi:signal transduction histidine kinase
VAADDTRALTILLVEDNPGDAHLIERHLDRADEALLAADYDLVHETDLESGFGVLEERAVDALLLDLGLPRSRGLETLERVLSHTDDVPIIVLTGLDDHDAAIEAIQKGAQDYLKKDSLDEDSLTRSLRYAIERKANRRELRRQNERLDEFASVVSHDLRNPLNVARGRIELAREECDGEHLEIAEGALDRMERLVVDLLALARQGRTLDERDAVSLEAVTREAWRNVDAPDSTVETVPPADAAVVADRSRLIELMENLFRNAVEHGSTDDRWRAGGEAVDRDPATPDSEAPGSVPDCDRGGGWDDDSASASGVRIRVGALDDETGFYVADDGPGIPEGDRDRVFEHGYTTDPDGTGFGLSIVESIAEAHGWDVRATDADGGGARFEVLERGGVPPERLAP